MTMQTSSIILAHRILSDNMTYAHLQGFAFHVRVTDMAEPASWLTGPLAPYGANMRRMIVEQLKSHDAKPHDVRGDIRDDDEFIYLMDHPDSDEEIPTLDISPYLSGRQGGCETVASRLRDISRTVGFFYLKGHGIPQELIDRVFEQAKRFHAMPLEAKKRIPFFDTRGFKSGYQPCFRDNYHNRNLNIISKAKPNLVAKFAINREGGSGGLSMSEEQRRAQVNIWPEDLPGFKETLLAYHGSIEHLGRKLHPLWAASLKPPLDYIHRTFTPP